MNDAVPVWKRCLDPATQSAEHYLDYVHTPLFPLIEGVPRRVLDLGCATGAFGATVKSTWPGAHVTGVELGQAAAERAATRIDRVVRASLDRIDFAAHGLAPGEFDLVVAADVLEHLVNPWDMLLRVKPLIAAGGQLVASIPNARNISVAGPLLADGEFRYAERGLLDITHLRFFTLKTILQLFAETGYRVESYQGLLMPGLDAAYQQYRGRTVPQIKLGRITLENVTEQELIELCTGQFLVRARPAA